MTQKLTLRISLRISWNLADFMKSGGFHKIWQISWNPAEFMWNLINSSVSAKTLQFDECRVGGMTQDFMKSWVIAPLHSIKLKTFCWNIWFYKVFGGFHEIRQISHLFTSKDQLPGMVTPMLFLIILQEVGTRKFSRWQAQDISDKKYKPSFQNCEINKLK